MPQRTQAIARLKQPTKKLIIRGLKEYQLQAWKVSKSFSSIGAHQIRIPLIQNNLMTDMVINNSLKIVVPRMTLKLCSRRLEQWLARHLFQGLNIAWKTMKWGRYYRRSEILPRMRERLRRSSIWLRSIFVNKCLKAWFNGSKSSMKTSCDIKIYKEMPWV